jgi:hypothetical protein
MSGMTSPLLSVVAAALGIAATLGPASLAADPLPTPLPTTAPATTASTASRPTPRPLNEQVGVNIHFTRGMPGELAMLRRAGFSVVRMDLFWHDVEREKGVYDFRAYDHLMDTLDQHGLRAQLILCYTNVHHDDDRSPHSDAGIAGFARFAGAAAAHFKGRNIDWEIYNEPNITPFWRPVPHAATYARLALAAAEAIRAADPQAVVVGPATSKIPLDFLETCFASGLLEHWDAVTVHPYRQRDPESVVGDYRALRSLIRRHAPAGKDVPIWSGEWGYSTAWPGIDDAEQARRVQRQILVNAAEGVQRSIWYDWRDDGRDPTNAEHRFGLVQHDFSGDDREPFAPKPSYRAVQTLLTALEGFAFDKRLWTGDDRDWVLLFAKDGTPKLAAWTTSHEPRTVSLPIVDVPLTLTRDVAILEPDALNARAAEALAAAAVPIDTVVTAPATAPDGSAITRGQDGRALFVRTPLPSGGEITQRTVLAVRNFIKVEWSPRPDGFTLTVRGAAGEAFDGVLKVVDPERRIGAAWRADEQPLRSGWFFARESENPRGTLVDRDGTVLLEQAAPRVRRVPLHPYTSRLGGDEHVAATVRPGGNPFDDIVVAGYSFEEGWKYLEINPQAPIDVPADAEAFGMWVSGDGSGNLLRMRFMDAGGETWQVDGPAMSFRGDRFVAFPLDGTESGHWGGDGNGRIDPPIRLTTFLLIDSAARQKTGGSVVLEGACFLLRPNR